MLEKTVGFQTCWLSTGASQEKKVIDGQWNQGILISQKVPKKVIRLLAPEKCPATVTSNASIM